MPHGQHNQGEFGSEPIRGMVERRDTGPSDAAPEVTGRRDRLGAGGRDIQREPAAPVEMGTDDRLEDTPPNGLYAEPLPPTDGGTTVSRENVETGASVVSALSALAGVL
jgi:hypothetical protein